jgi:hypothetical protein
MLAVVQHQQQALGVESLGQGVLQGTAALFAHTQNRGHRLRY